MLQPVEVATRTYWADRPVSSNRHEKPYFCPLNKEYYLKFKGGLQDCEIRPNNHRGWNVNNIYPGREIALSNGYQKAGRLTKPIMRTLITHDLTLENIPQWHIDAVENIYGKRESWLIAYVGR